MSDTFDHEGDAWDSAMDAWDGCENGWGSAPVRMRAAKPDITCKRCRTPAYWQEVVGPDGRPKIRLFSGGKPHLCPGASVDEFEAG
jgi:hypothetical protein